MVISISIIKYNKRENDTYFDPSGRHTSEVIGFSPKDMLSTGFLIPLFMSYILSFGRIEMNTNEYELD